MKTKLRMKCRNCSQWNRFEVEKLAVEQPSSESKATYLIPYYMPLKEEKCTKCGSVIAEKKELIRIIESKRAI